MTRNRFTSSMLNRKRFTPSMLKHTCFTPSMLNRKRFTPSLLKHTCFTLIELLVCVAIIAILASMLLPVLRRARYHAQMVVCINNLKQIATAGMMYADDNDSHYVRRESMSLGTCNLAAPFRLKKGSDYDDRPILSKVYNLEELQCPILGPIPDLMTRTDDARSSYAIYYSWNFARYYSSRQEKGMDRVGDKMTYGADDFDIVVGDSNWTRNGYLNGKFYTKASHPDTPYGGGSMQRLKWDYQLKNSIARNPIDLNYAREDGSAFTAKRVTYNDTRMSKVPYKALTGGYPPSQVETGAWSLLPSTKF